jgi:tRNA(adenine34) deaminase
MMKAYDLALKAYEEGEIPVGAIVVTETGSIIGKGYNQTERLGDVTAHAEILAITAASQHLGSKYLKDCRLYVSLEPCVMCAGALAWSQIDMVIYGASDKKKGFNLINSPLLHPKTEILGGILAKESEQLLKDFFKKLR